MCRCRTTQDLSEFQNIERKLTTPFGYFADIILFPQSEFFFPIPQGRTPFGRDNTSFPHGKRKTQRLIRPNKIIFKRNSKLNTNNEPRTWEICTEILRPIETIQHVKKSLRYYVCCFDI